MMTFAHSLSLAQEVVHGFNTKDDSTLAYVSCLVALETVMPYSNAEEMEFSVTVGANHSICIEPDGLDLDGETLETINQIASHYFHSKRCNLPVLVH
jgi:hypothetical protein